MELRVVPGGFERRRERPRRSAGRAARGPSRRRPAHPGAARRPPRGRAATTAPGTQRCPGRVHGAQLLQEQLRGVVVAPWSMKRRIVESGAESTEPSGRRPRAPRPSRPPATETPAFTSAARNALRRRERGIGVVRASDAAAVDGERRERRRLGDVVRGAPAWPGAARVEGGLVGEDAPGDVPDPVRRDLGREVGRSPRRRASGRRGPGGRGRPPGRVVLLAAPEDVRLEPEDGAELLQGRERDRELLVRGGRSGASAGGRRRLPVWRS